MAIKPSSKASKETTVQFSIGGGHRIYAISGVARFIGLEGVDDSTPGHTYDIEIPVGPVVKEIAQVSAHMCINSFSHVGSDEDDNSGWAIDKQDWVEVQFPNGEQVLLRAVVMVMGEGAALKDVGYHVVIDEQQG